MMSHCSSESSLNNEEDQDQQSTVSSKTSGSHPPPRQSLDSMIADDRARIQNQDYAGSDLNDMPSLTSFRFDDASTVRTEGEYSLPSLSSYRMDELSMSSSYHSNAHLSASSEGSETWNSISFSSGFVSQGGWSQDTGSSDSANRAAPNSTTSSIERHAPLRTESMPQMKSTSSDGRNLSPNSALDRRKVANARKQGRLMGFKGNEPIISILKKPRPISPMRNTEEDGGGLSNLSPMLPIRQNSGGMEHRRSSRNHQKAPIKSAMKPSSAQPTKDDIIRLPVRKSNPSNNPSKREHTSSNDAPKPPSRRRLSPQRHVGRAASMPTSEIERGPRRGGLGGSSSSSFRTNDLHSSLSSTGIHDSLPKLPRRFESRGSSHGNSSDDDGVVIVINKNKGNSSRSSPREKIKKRLSSERSQTTAETEKISSEENDDDDDNSDFSEVDDDGDSDSSVSVDSVDSDVELPLGVPLKSQQAATASVLTVPLRPAPPPPPPPADVTPTMVRRRQSIEKNDEIDISENISVGDSDSDIEEDQTPVSKNCERPAYSADGSSNFDTSPTVGKRRSSLPSNDGIDVKAIVGLEGLESDDLSVHSTDQAKPSAALPDSTSTTFTKPPLSSTKDSSDPTKDLPKDDGPSATHTGDIVAPGTSEEEDLAKASSLIEIIVQNSDAKCPPKDRVSTPGQEPEGTHIDGTTAEDPKEKQPNAAKHKGRGPAKLRKALSNTLKGIARASSFKGGQKPKRPSKTS
jgi:hypothetical protein